MFRYSTLYPHPELLDFSDSERGTRQYHSRMSWYHTVKQAQFSSHVASVVRYHEGYSDSELCKIPRWVEHEKYHARMSSKHGNLLLTAADKPDIIKETPKETVQKFRFGDRRYEIVMVKQDIPAYHFEVWVCDEDWEHDRILHRTFCPEEARWEIEDHVWWQETRMEEGYTVC